MKTDIVFTIEASDIPRHWVCYDAEKRIICTFKDKQFLKTHKCDAVEEDYPSFRDEKVAFNLDRFWEDYKILSDMTKWLIENHLEKLVSAKILIPAREELRLRRLKLSN